MKLLLFGPNGQVGRALMASDGGRNHSLISCDRTMADLSVPGAAAASILAERPDAIINAAAYTAVDKAEVEQAHCTRLNTEAPEEMALAAASIGAAFVHLSTDYVFDGSTRAPLDERAATNPLNVYGLTKLAGEERVMSAGGRSAIIRTSWVYSAHGANFVKTILRLSETRPSLSVVNDQIGAPTPSDAIANACLTVAEGLTRGGASGLFHFQGSPSVSWADFARAILSAAGRAMAIVDIPTSAYPTPARRPLRTVLDCRRIEAAYGITQPDWRSSTHEIVRGLVAA